MFQKDYILRIIEELAKLLARVLGLIKNNDFEPAENLLEKAYELLKLDRSWKDKSIPEIIKHLNSMESSFGQMEAIADILRTEGDFYFAQERPEAEQYWLKALAIYEYIEKSDKVFSFERNNKLNDLKVLLNQPE